MENVMKNLDKQLMYNNQKVSTGTTYLLFLCFGYSYGRFDQWGKQILFWITFGGFGIWALILLFTLGSKVKEHNRKIAMRCGFDNEELVKYNLI